jgi:tetratricopeptide (TPR) repeat protein
VFVLAKFYARTGRHAEALKLCRAARETNSADLVASAAASVIGHGQPSDADLADAESLVQDALQKNANSAQAVIALAGLRLVQRRFREAEAIYRGLVRPDATNVTALNNLAYVLSFEGRESPEGIDLVERAMQKSGRTAALLDTRALLLLNAGKTAEALQDLEEAFSGSRSAIGHLHLAKAHLQANHPAEAAIMLGRAQALRLRLDELHSLEREIYEQVANNVLPETTDREE